MLRTLPAQLRELLDANDPAVERLFPPAHPDDRGLEADYRGLVHDDLLAQRRSALDVMEATIDARRLDEEQMLGWLGAVNDLRLVFGTRLKMTDDMTPEEVDPNDPQAPAFALYYYLGWLEEQIVEALAEGLDPAGTVS